MEKTGRLIKLSCRARVLGNFRYLFVLADTISGWRAAFSTRNETSAEVAKAVLK